ncbi:MAG TPA: GNAT family N-acetyltransferase [Thermoplasmata archaeon]|nr:GNAT family N-acetyltransferase [Thermoplasmata archaeon]
MDTAELLRACLDFERTWAETGATVRRTPYGATIRNDRFPRIHLANLAWVERMPPGGVGEILDDLDDAFAGTAVRHRNVVFQDAQSAFENQEVFAARGFRPLAELAMARVGLPACITNPEVAIREVGKEASEDDYRRLRMRVFTGLEYDREASGQLFAIARDHAALLGERDYVAYVHETPAGTTSLWPRGRIAYIGDVATMPEFRNRGVARTLVFDISKRALAAGCEYSVLLTDPFDSPRDMYTTLGYQPVGEIRSFLKLGPPA